MMKKVSCSFALLVAVVAAVVLVGEVVQLSSAVTCDVVQLSPCLAAFQSTAPPSGDCCKSLREQKPCLCGYAKNPAFSPYLSSPAAGKISSACKVPFPKC